jgi:hypothetical protein
LNESQTIRMTQTPFSCSETLIANWDTYRERKRESSHLCWTQERKRMPSSGGLWETPDERQIVPILLVKVRRGDADASISEQPRGGTVLPPKSADDVRRKTGARSGADARRGWGCGAAVCGALLLLMFLMLLRVG